MSRHPTPFSHPAAVKVLARRLFPALGAKRTAQVVAQCLAVALAIEPRRR